MLTKPVLAAAVDRSLSAGSRSGVGADQSWSWWNGLPTEGVDQSYICMPNSPWPAEGVDQSLIGWPHPAEGADQSLAWYMFPTEGADQSFLFTVYPTEGVDA